MMNLQGQAGAGETAGAAEKVEIVSFGCRLNLIESEAAVAAARASGLESAVIINTCAVTGEAVRQARQTIRRLGRANPHARIIVSGCAAETERAQFEAMPEVAAVIGNAQKTSKQAWRALAQGALEFRSVAELRQADVFDVTAVAGHTRGFLPIQNGCDHRCTFCIIPYGRGPSRSLPAGVVVAQARALVEAGVRDIVLTGVDLTSWGADLPGAPTLGALVRRLLRAAPDLARLRLSSLDCIEADEELIRAFAEEERFMPHLHLSLQAGDDMILKRMKRRHLRGDAISLCATIRRLRPDVVFGADLIAGFPTESEAMFQNSLKLVEECGLTHLHVFPFSPRPGTPAARMPQQDRACAKERAGRLRALGAQRLRLHLDQQIGREIEVLTERGGKGLARDFTEVATPQAAPGQLLRGRVTGHDGRMLHFSPLADQRAL